MAVQAALTHALNLWKHVSPKNNPNGALVFSSADSAEILQPPMPLKRRIYNCGKKFDTSVLQSCIDAALGPTYGVIAVDGSDAAFGKVQGLTASTASGIVISELGHLGSHIAARTRRGGQSALRYARSRDESELAFLRKVAERAGMLFTDIRGIILGGKADMKQKLQAELPDLLKKQVVCSVDLPCNASSEALRQAALRAAATVASSDHSGAELSLKNFFELTEQDFMYCYGKEQTGKALEMGAVEDLLLAAEKEIEPSLDEWRALAALHGTHVVEIHPVSQAGVKFCQSFVFGGCLRWELLEDQEDGEHQQSHTSCISEDPVESSDFLAPEAPVSQGSSETAVRQECEESEALQQHQRETLEWFRAELQDCLNDASTAEAVVACVEVLLSDEVTPQDELRESVLAVVSAEGVPEELAMELMRRW